MKNQPGNVRRITRLLSSLTNTTNTMQENTNVNNVFIEASKRKLRFSANGMLCAEDLWDLPLTKLDTMAVDIDTELGKSRKSFLANPDTPKNVEDELRLEVLKVVIEMKQAENSAKLTAAKLKARKEFLERLLEQKRINQLESLPIEEIEKQLTELNQESYA